ncbi:MAG: hypothetical protein LC658_04575 [Bacteroidales bacterium]|nr:hypothetical protein [Bacteroidales bacterium]
MRKIFFVTLLLCTSLLNAQQNFNLNDPIPVDPKVSKGVLENGMTWRVGYY